LMLGNRDLTRLLRRRHGDLFRVDYWEDVQRQLQAGKVPAIRIYPESDTLELPDSHTENNEEITEGFYTPEQST